MTLLLWSLAISLQGLVNDRNERVQHAFRPLLVSMRRSETLPQEKPLGSLQQSAPTTVFAAVTTPCAIDDGAPRFSTPRVLAKSDSAIGHRSSRNRWNRGREEVGHFA